MHRGAQCCTLHKHISNHSTIRGKAGCARTSVLRRPIKRRSGASVEIPPLWMHSITYILDQLMNAITLSRSAKLDRLTHLSRVFTHHREPQSRAPSFRSTNQSSSWARVVCLAYLVLVSLCSCFPVLVVAEHADIDLTLLGAPCAVLDKHALIYNDERFAAWFYAVYESLYHPPIQTGAAELWP
jgi:hypothetical protein